MWKFWPFRKTARPSAPPPASPPPAAPPQAARPRVSAPPLLSRSSNAFAFDLWGQVGKKVPGNLALSPASITFALAMTWGGARGETASEMQRVLHLEGASGDILASAGKLLQDWSAGTGSTLQLVNRLFGEKTYTFDQSYLDLTQTTFGAALEPVDFANDSQGVRGFINEWVAQQTADRIRDLVPPEGVDGRTRLALVNAIYFKATWANPFEEDSTRDEPFFLAPDTKKDVSMMHGEDSYRFAALEGVKLLELPYEARDAAMIFVLPDAVDGLDALERTLTNARLDGWIAAMEYETVRVVLPRCEVDPADAITLADALRELGMQRAFTREADFTGIARSPRPGDELLLSEVFHKTFVRIDEQGTEAAAGTAVIMVEGSAMEEEPPKEFRADHPFLFFLRDTRSGMLLFMGRIADPSA
ncbi:serpin family protein [Hyalangium sp.]|uniref:serpin family protein n=1 Tax=Hyalangium sp. TaxID=2028555 RepID=UPI002D5147C7|nr:serpin family protein [Hyalangium sp.]HYI00934.1 serpin family protein [Hyalangium sp.]